MDKLTHNICDTQKVPTRIHISKTTSNSRSAYEFPKDQAALTDSMN